MPKVSIFYCYAREDQALRDELAKHLSVMKRQDQITTWHDREISAGQPWKDEIASHLDTANIILLLISPDFIHSDYCYSVEMQRALQRHASGEARVIPIILRSALWKDAPFSKLQTLPTNGTPVVKWESQDDAFVNVAEEIRRVVNELLIEQLKVEDFQDYLEKRCLEVIAAYEQATEIDPQNALAYGNKGDAFYTLKRYEDALTAYEVAIQLDPENARTHNGKGKTLHALQRYEDALIAHDEAIRIDPHFAETYQDKAATLEALAIQTRHKAAEIEHPHSHELALFPDQETDGGGFIRLGEMIKRGKISGRRAGLC